jgi:multiple sugar transport system permease protein
MSVQTMSRKLSKGQTTRLLLTILYGLIGLIFITPLIWMLSTSFKYESQVFEKPFVLVHWDDINFNNYIYLLTESHVMTWMGNSIVVVVVSVLCRLLFAAIAGYAFGYLKFKHANIIFMFYLMTMFIPYQLSLLPQFIAFRYIGFLDTHWALIVPNIVDVLSIFLMRQFFLTFPRDFIHAAYLEGSGVFRSFIRIALPLAKTPLLTLGILSFFMIWDQYYQPLIFLKSPEKFTIPLGLHSFQTQYGLEYAKQMALACIAIIPVLGTFIVLQKQVVESIMSSGIKG